MLGRVSLQPCASFHAPPTPKELPVANTSTDQDVAEDLLYLMACAVNDTCPDSERISSMDLPSVLELARFHSVAAMAGLALKKSMPLPPKWDQEVATSEYRYALMKAERTQVIAALAQEGIRCACLKGIILAEYYPSPAMREMCDNDILYEYTPENALTVRHIMEGMGYQTKAFDGANTDEYVKRPIFNFEMHTALESAETATLRHGDRVFDGVWKHAVPLASEPGAYALDPSDFYLYFIAHAFKHYRTGTIGVRVLADTCIVRKALLHSLDKDRVRNGLALLGAADFDTRLNELAMELMSTPSKTRERLRSLSSRYETMFAMMLGSGTYGTASTVMQRRLGEISEEGKPTRSLRRRYLADRLFPSVEIIEMNYPICRRYPVLLPLFYAYRIIHGAITKRGAIEGELGVLDSELSSNQEPTCTSQDQSK